MKRKEDQDRIVKEIRKERQLREMTDIRKKTRKSKK
jgi:hypothetical protein